MGILLKTTLTSNGMNLTKFERLAKSEYNFKFSRRTLNALIDNERGDFRLSWFSMVFQMAGLDFYSIMKDYFLNLNVEEKEQRG